jgi:hypothetical protein
MSRRARALAMVGALAALSPAAARAAPCCGEQGALGARLLRDESLAILTSVGFAERIGGWNAAGAYGALGPAAEERHLRFDESLAVRAGSRVELGVTIPEIVGYRALSGQTEAGGGAGDLVGSMRVTLAKIDDTSLTPAVFTTLAASIPAGRPPWLGSPLASDVTGEGAPEVSLGLAFEKTWVERWFAVASASAGFFVPVRELGAVVARGPRFTIDATTGPVFELDPIRTLACGAGVEYEGEVAGVIDGSSESTGRTRWSIAAPCAIDLSARWSLLSKIRSDLPVDHAGSSEAAEVSVTLGVRFGARSWDL